MTILGETVMTQNSTYTESPTLTQARNLIGLLHQSRSCGQTQDFQQPIESNPANFGFSHLGEKVLKTTLDEAAYALVNTNGKLSKSMLAFAATSKEALFFILGTGLDIMLNVYNLDYDADRLRSVFCRQFHVKT